jgi:hypothetical protein
VNGAFGPNSAGTFTPHRRTGEAPKPTTGLMMVMGVAAIGAGPCMGRRRQLADGGRLLGWRYATRTICSALQSGDGEPLRSCERLARRMLATSVRLFNDLFDGVDNDLWSV